MPKTKFRVVHEGTLDCGDLYPDAVAAALLAQEQGVLDEDALYIWEAIPNIKCVSVEVVKDDA